jgi:hypothetical protein
MVAKLVPDSAWTYQAWRAFGHGLARFLEARAVPGLFFWPVALLGTARLMQRA